ncbi:hypothetical protein ACHAL6_11710 [Proteiniclasticum sp. C24MP]|uniref:hypothetical protein n=1 Tax=Proteiniclasticum sp. C24MP TaxID=3374101 RepID=UPI003754D624
MEKKETKGIVVDGLIIAFLTAYSYLLSYRYQDGYYSFFNLPSFLIEIRIENVLTSFVSILGFAYLIYIVVSIITGIIPDTSDPIIVKLVFKYIYFGTISTINSILGAHIYKDPYNIYIILIGGMFIIDFLVPFITQRKLKGYKNKVVAEYNKTLKAIDTFEYKKSINNNIRRYFPSLPLILVTGYMVSSLTFQLGSYNAHKQDTFTTINDEVVILGTYNNDFIAKELDIAQRTLEPDFYLISDLNNNRYIKKNIGSLTVK